MNLEKQDKYMYMYMCFFMYKQAMISHMLLKSLCYSLSKLEWYSFCWNVNCTIALTEYSINPVFILSLMLYCYINI